ncbi:MAG: DapH/DapD/GlmU-related protein [Bacteroidota bacterium]
MDNKVPIIIIGTGNSGKVALEIANSLEVLVYSFLTSREEEINGEINDIPIFNTLGSQDSAALLADENVKLVIAEQEIADRKAAVGAILDATAETVTISHASAIISAHATLGKGNLISPSVVIHPNVLIGSYNQLETAASLEPGVQVGEFCTIQAGARIGAETILGDEVFIGAGAILRKGITIGKGAIIGAGSIVMADVGEEKTVFGNPAKEI